MELWVFQAPVHHLMVVDDFRAGLCTLLLLGFAAVGGPSSPTKRQLDWVLALA